MYRAVSVLSHVSPSPCSDVASRVCAISLTGVIVIVIVIVID